MYQKIENARNMSNEHALVNFLCATEFQFFEAALAVGDGAFLLIKLFLGLVEVALKCGEVVTDSGV